MAVRKCCSTFIESKVLIMNQIPFSWVTGEWEDCSASCGQTGWQRRWLSCQQVHSTGQQQRSVPSSLCKDNRPVGKRACNRWSCPPSWRAGPWTPVWPVPPAHKTITDYHLGKSWNTYTLLYYWPSENFQHLDFFILFFNCRTTHPLIRTTLTFLFFNVDYFKLFVDCW